MRNISSFDLNYSSNKLNHKRPSQNRRCYMAKSIDNTLDIGILGIVDNFAYYFIHLIPGQGSQWTPMNKCERCSPVDCEASTSTYTTTNRYMSVKLLPFSKSVFTPFIFSETNIATLRFDVNSLS